MADKAKSNSSGRTKPTNKSKASKPAKKSTKSTKPRRARSRSKSPTRNQAIKPVRITTYNVPTNSTLNTPCRVAPPVTKVALKTAEKSGWLNVLV